MRVVPWALLLLFGTWPVVGAQSPARVQVPRGEPITLDGLVDDGEWRNALRIEHPPGTVVRLLRDEASLFIGITSSRAGFASLCVAGGGAVHVLHASAALGAVTYRPRGDVWQSADTAFRYAMRNRALDDAARGQRAAYLAEHGWVASTIDMGGRTAQEMQLSLSRFPLPVSIALGRFLLPDGLESWPSSLAPVDGCVAPELVRGDVPRALRFDTGRWVPIAPWPP